MAGLESIALAVEHLERVSERESSVGSSVTVPEEPQASSLGTTHSNSNVEQPQLSLPPPTGLAPRIVSADSMSFSTFGSDDGPPGICTVMDPAANAAPDSNAVVSLTLEQLGRSIFSLDLKELETIPIPSSDTVIPFVFQHDVLCGRGRSIRDC
jgi:hypothetical protein